MSPKPKILRELFLRLYPHIRPQWPNRQLLLLPPPLEALGSGRVSNIRTRSQWDAYQRSRNEFTGRELEPEHENFGFNRKKKTRRATRRAEDDLVGLEAELDQFGFDRNNTTRKGKTKKRSDEFIRRNLDGLEAELDQFGFDRNKTTRKGKTKKRSDEFTRRNLNGLEAELDQFGFDENKTTRKGKTKKRAEDKMELDEEDTSAQRARVRRKYTKEELYNHDPWGAEVRRVGAELREFREMNKKAAGTRKKQADLDEPEDLDKMDIDKDEEDKQRTRRRRQNLSTKNSGEQTANERRQLFVGGF